MMTLWWAAFIVLGALSPPSVPLEWIAVSAAALLTASVPGDGGVGPRPGAAPGARVSGSAVASCAVAVATALILWEGAGLERRSFDVDARMAPGRGCYAAGSKRETRVPGDTVRFGAGKSREIPGTLGRLRGYLIGSLADGRLGRTGKGIVGALVLDHRADLGFDLSETYSYLGITHFLALSGMHLGVIAVPLSKMCSLLVRSRNGRDILLFLILCLYAAIAAFPASLSRALAVSAAMVVYRLLGLRPGLLTALVGGCLALVVVDSQVLFDVGFELSFAAVCGIALIGIPLSRAIDARLPGGFGGTALRWLIFPAVITCSVQFLTMPLTIVLFKRASLISPVVNVIVSMPFTALLYLGVVYVFVPFGALRTALAIPINLICRFLDVVPRAFSRSPHAAVYSGDFDILLYLIGVGFVSYALRRATRSRLDCALAGVFLVAVSFMMRSTPPALEPNDRSALRADAPAWQVSVRGATYMPRGGGVLILDEVFSRGDAYRLTRELWGRGVREIELCVVLPARPRRIGGLSYLAKRVSVREVVCSRYLAAADRSLGGALRACGARLRPVAAGDTLVTRSFAVAIAAPRFPPAKGSSVGVDSLRIECRVIERPCLTSGARAHSMLTVR